MNSPVHPGLSLSAIRLEITYLKSDLLAYLRLKPTVTHHVWVALLPKV